MNGCIYRTKDNECDLYAEGGKYQAFCDLENCKDRRQSNADRIRSLSDEELAEFLERKTPWYRCDNCKWESCKDCCLDWLKKEVEGETDEDKA